MSIIQEFKNAFSERFEVIRYVAQVGAKISVEWGGQKVDAKGIVTCEGKDIELVFCFVDGDPGRYQPTVNAQKRTAAVFLRVEEMPIVLDLLRNEKPVFGYVNEKHPGSTKISTSVEPVGEFEG